MSEHYHDENDVKLMREVRKLAPQDFNAWLGFNSIVGRENGAIPRKYRELIAIHGCVDRKPHRPEDIKAKHSFLLFRSAT